MKCDYYVTFVAGQQPAQFHSQSIDDFCVVSEVFFTVSTRHNPKGTRRDEKRKETNEPDGLGDCYDANWERDEVPGMGGVSPVRTSGRSGSLVLR